MKCSVAQLLAGLQLTVLLYELQLDQLTALHPFLWIFLQYSPKKLPEFLGEFLAGWELYLICDLYIVFSLRF